MRFRLLSRLARTGASLAIIACASGKPSSSPNPPPPTGPTRVLGFLTAERIAVLPAQQLRREDTLGWGSRAAQPRELLSALDDEIAFALGERGLRDAWVYAPAIARAARRNPTYAADPYALAVVSLAATERDAATFIPDPLASQLRTLAALTDVRYMLLPLHLRFEPAGTGGRAVLALALIDVRAAQVRWRGEVAGDPAPTFSPALTASVASRLADLIAAR